jgi:MFS family permease
LKEELADLPLSAWAICIGTFLSKLCNFLNIFLVLYVESFRAGPNAVVISFAMLGIGSVLGSLLGGWAADAFGARNSLVVALAGSGVVIASVPILPNLSTLYVVLFVGGLLAQVVRPAAGALLVHILPPQHRLTAFTLLRLGVNLGMSIGPAIGGLAASTSFAPLFIANGVVNCIYAALIVICVKEVKRRSRIGIRHHSSWSILLGYSKLRHDRSFSVFLLGSTLAALIYSQSVSTLPLVVIDAGLGADAYGYLLALNAVVIIAFEFPVMRLLRRARSTMVMAAGVATLALGLSATGLALSFLGFALTVVVWSLGEIIYTPFTTTHPGQVAPAHSVGRYQGAESLSNTLGAAVGPLIGTSLYSISPSGMWFAMLVIGLVAAGSFLLVRLPAIEVGADMVRPDPAEEH